MSRLVIVSNRVGPVTDTGRAGGLAIALAEALQAKGGIWFGWSGRITDRAERELHEQVEGDLTLLTMDLTAEELEEYYEGFANRCLWPLFHYRIDLTAFDRRYWGGYLAANYRFAEALVPRLQPDDLVWVHDYHFLAFGEALRALGARQRLGFFLHIPVPPPEVLATLPRVDGLMRALCDYDVVGFQTEVDLDHFVRFLVLEHGGWLSGDTVHAFGRRVIVRALPIGIDVDRFAGFATTPEAREVAADVERELRGRLQIVGVDRLDYTKGLPERFHAFERFLQDFPDHRGRVSFLQVAPLSRERVEEYQRVREQLEGITGRINGRFAEVDWTPVRYLNRGFGRRELAGLYRASRVGLVTPLRDGMNLVAMEYVAAQDPEDPGALVLSRFAGAARLLRGAVLVNPYDVDGVAEAIDAAVTMPLEERRRRHATMMAALREHDVASWRDAFLDVLADAG